jgi:hypothetical protein
MVLSVALAAIIFRPLRDAGGFHVPSKSEAAGAHRMFASAFSDGDEQALSAASAPFGLETKKVSENGWQGLRISETEESCEGRGAYLLRDDKAALPVVLMAPHRGADRWTGEITASLFSDHPFTAAAWNSAPRRASDECKAGGDVTRVETHFFTAFSLAFAEQFPHGRVIQIHGFEKELRTSGAGRAADMIISNGSDTPGDGLLNLADCLSHSFPEHNVRVYPLDVQELGATQNSQGQALREAGFAGFAHIEISNQLRRSFLDDPQMRASFAHCLAVGTK